MPTLDQWLVIEAIVGDLRRLDQRLAMGSSPLFIDPVHGSALMRAVQSRSTAMVDRLLKSGADPNAVFPATGKSATDYAMENRVDGTYAFLCFDHGGTRPLGFVPGPNLGDLKEYDWSLWPRSFVEKFAIHCEFECCDWDACDFGTDGVSAVMAATGLGLDELRAVTLEALTTEPTGNDPKVHGLHEHMRKLLQTIDDWNKAADNPFLKP